MGKKRIERKKVLCPFYKYETAYKVICEGCTERSSWQQSFETPEAKRKYCSRYCDRDWEACIVAKALMSKYD